SKTIQRPSGEMSTDIHVPSSVVKSTSCLSPRAAVTSQRASGAMPWDVVWAKREAAPKTCAHATIKAHEASERHLRIRRCPEGGGVGMGWRRVARGSRLWRGYAGGRQVMEQTWRLAAAFASVSWNVAGHRFSCPLVAPHLPSDPGRCDV